MTEDAVGFAWNPETVKMEDSREREAKRDLYLDVHDFKMIRWTCLYYKKSECKTVSDWVTPTKIPVQPIGYLRCYVLEDAWIYWVSALELEPVFYEKNEDIYVYVII